MEKFKELLMSKAKKGDVLNDEESGIMSGVLDQMDAPMNEKRMGKLKKVTVAAPNEELLKKGLDTAEEIIAPDESSKMPNMDNMTSMDGESEDESGNDEESRIANLEAQIEELKKMIMERV